MRDERQVMDLILEIAKSDPRIRGAYLNGSRTNPNAKKDIFQDYDLVYLVDATRTFIEEESWISKFGQVMYMQNPDKMDFESGLDVNLDQCYGYLVQFTDGVRIDLRLMDLSYGIKNLKEDKLSIVLLDKDNILPEVGQPSDEDYWITKPTDIQYRNSCNEFWWCLNNLAKGLWRGEILYVMDMLDYNLRPELKNLIRWHIGARTDFSISLGKSDKYMEGYLEEDIYEAYLSTYPSGSLDDIWRASFSMANLFQDLAIKVGDKLGFVYDLEEASQSMKFFKNAQGLPKDTREIFV